MLENKEIKREKLEIDDSFLNEKVLAATLDLIPWLAYFGNYLVSDIIPKDLSYQH